MSAIYDNWERLVAAVVKKQQLWELFHDHSRSPSMLSEASDFSSSLHDLGFDFSGSSSKSPPKLVVLSDFNPLFDVKDVRLASLKSLGRGTFGSVYRATVDGERIVVKRLNPASISELDFKRYMEIVGDFQHGNVVVLRAYYSSKDERLMLYDDYGKRSLYSLLHGQIGDTRAHVDWETRLRIAIGAARGIAEIHTQLGGILVHGNIKASNIFLDLQSYGCVSDIGLTSMIKTTFNPTSHCYAPEVKNTQDASHASDVYSFGVLLLELLTRKSSAYVPGGPVPVDLVKLVNLIKNQERAAKVFDADLLKRPNLCKQMVKMLQIGTRCVAKSIKKRPKMSTVVKMLEDIITIRHRLNPLNQDSSERKLVFLEDANPTFDLEDLIRASAEVLGEGTFGTCYKVKLENGNIIVVKRLRDVILTFEDFQQHMEVFGKMRHENVVTLRAYYFSSQEKLLVYDYYNQGSISALLHGGIGASPLKWEARLEIAVGAARGIAHIHRKDGQKFVHGNVKSSNIFLNRQSYGAVSDAGLAKLMSPSGLPDTLSRAPEIRDTKVVSQASDVYSFGVVLLELISGMPSQHTTDDGEVVSLVEWIQSIIRDEGIGKVEFLRCENNKEMVQLLQIAMSCVSSVPKERPRMFQVLEGISGIQPAKERGELECLLEKLVAELTPPEY